MSLKIMLLISLRIVNNFIIFHIQYCMLSLRPHLNLKSRHLQIVIYYTINKILLLLFFMLKADFNIIIFIIFYKK